MTMTEPTQPSPNKPKRAYKRRKQARRSRPADPATKVSASELDGLTIANCPKACGAERCVISGAPLCAHPAKGGLQGKYQHNPDALDRFKAAKRMLGKQKIDIETE